MKGRLIHSRPILSEDARPEPALYSERLKFTFSRIVLSGDIEQMSTVLVFGGGMHAFLVSQIYVSIACP
jgi:hypothetical protein